MAQSTSFEHHLHVFSKLKEDEATEYFFKHGEIILRGDRDVIISHLKRRNSDTIKEIRNTLINEAAKDFPTFAHKTPRRRTMGTPICEDIYILGISLLNKDPQLLPSVYKEDETETTPAEVAAAAEHDEATAAALQQPDVTDHDNAPTSPIIIEPVIQTTPTVPVSTTPPVANSPQPVVYTHTQPAIPYDTYPTYPYANYGSVLQKMADMENQIYSLSRQLNTQQFYNEQKDIKLYHMEQWIHTLERRTTECEAIARQSLHGTQPPSGGQGMNVTPHTGPEEVPIPAEDQPLSSSLPDDEETPSANSDDPTTVTATSAPTPIPAPRAQYTTAPDTAVSEPQLSPPKKLKPKITKTQDIFVGNLQDDLAKRDIYAAITDSGIDIDDDEIKIEEIQISTQGKGKAFKVTVPQSKYLEIYTIIESTNKEIKVESYRPKKPRTATQSNQQNHNQHQNTNNRNNHRNNSGGNNQRPFLKPKGKHQQHQREHYFNNRNNNAEWTDYQRWNNNFGPQAERGYYYHEDDYYYSNRINSNYNNHRDNWNGRW